MLGLGHLGGDLGVEGHVLGNAEDEVDVVVIAPGHQVIAAKAAIGAHDDGCHGPAGADLGDETGDLLDTASGGIDVGRPELGSQQVPAAEDIERQVAITVVEAVKEAAFLVAVQGHVGGVEIERDHGGRHRMRLQEDIDEQPLDGPGVVADLVVTGRRFVLALLRRVLQPVERALASQRRTALVARCQLAHHGREHRIMTQLVVVVDVLIAECQTDHALADQRWNGVLDPVGMARVGEGGGEPADQAYGLVGGTEQQRARVGGDLPPIEAGHD